MARFKLTKLAFFTAVVLVAQGAGVVALVLGGSQGAFADTAQTAQALRSDNVVVFDDAEAHSAFDPQQAQQAIGTANHLYVAVLPGRALDGTPEKTASNIVGALGDDSAVVVVVVGSTLGAAQAPHAPLAAGDAARIAASVDLRHNVRDVVNTALYRVRVDSVGGQNTPPQAPSSTDYHTDRRLNTSTIVGLVALAASTSVLMGLLAWRRTRALR